jgi:hypothetical protein
MKIAEVENFGGLPIQVPRKKRTEQPPLIYGPSGINQTFCVN